MTRSIWKKLRKKKKLKIVLRKEKEESGKGDVKLNIQNGNHESSPIISWQNYGETMETVRNFMLGVPKSLQMVSLVLKLKYAFSLEEKLQPG